MDLEDQFHDIERGYETMSRPRATEKVFKSVHTIEGAGVNLRRGFGHGHVPIFDPFLLFDDFRGDRPDDYIKGFPWHPHRGIETITYMLRGEVEHGDSMGNAGFVSAGDVQWMTAGSGIIHQEMPRGDGEGRMGGFQLWANLPASVKMMNPRYQDIGSGDVPEVTLEGGVTIRVLCGRVGDVEGPVRDIIIDPEYLDVALPAGTGFLHPTKPGHTVFAYVFEGRGAFGEANGESTVGDGDVVLFTDGDELTARTEGEEMRFLLVSGKPIGEPVAWRGPIVMNNQEELRIAFEEYEKGTFIKHE